MRQRWSLAAVLLLSSTIAAADPAPVSATIGVGVRGASWSSATPAYSSSGVAVALDAIVAARVTPHFAIGLRIGVGLPPLTATSVQDGDNTTYTVTSAALPVDVGLTVQYEHGPWWIAPWLGMHTARVTGAATICNYQIMPLNPSCFATSAPATAWTDTFRELGLTGGIDLARVGPVRIGAYADVQVGIGDYRAAELGLAFHE